MLIESFFHWKLYFVKNYLALDNVAESDDSLGSCKTLAIDEKIAYSD